MGGSCLADRLGHYVTLTPGEQSALDRLEEQQRQVRRGTVVINQGEPARELHILQKGWLQSSVLLDDGGRQIMRVHLPGDVVGLPALAFDEAPETVSALSEAVLCPFDRDRLTSLFAEHPRLAGLLFALAVAERAALADRLASIGRTSARARIASLLCDIFARIRLADGGQTQKVHVPLTQEEIGDATGLTAVHVNRMIRGLVGEGIIERSGSTIRLLDEQRLRAEASFVNRLQISTTWLPAAR